MSSSKKSQPSMMGILMSRKITPGTSIPLEVRSKRASKASFPFWKICTSSHWATGFRTFLIPNTVMGSSSTMNMLFTFLMFLIFSISLEKNFEGRAMAHFAFQPYGPPHGLDLVFDHIKADSLGVLSIVQGLVHAKELVAVSIQVQANAIVTYGEQYPIVPFHGLQDNPGPTLRAAVFDRIGQEVQDYAVQIGGHAVDFQVGRDLVDDFDLAFFQEGGKVVGHLGDVRIQIDGFPVQVYVDIDVHHLVEVVQGLQQAVGGLGEHGQ